MSLANSPNILGRGPSVPGSSSGVIGGPSSSTDTALVRWNGTTGTLVQDGVVLEATDSGTLTGPTANATTTAAGSAFGNQPSNDSVTIASSNAADIMQTVTIIGTTTGGNVVVVETDALNGTTPVVTTKVNWGKILAVKLSASCAGTVTISKTTGLLTITTITTTNLSAGVNVVAAANQLAYNRTISVVSNGATTKQIGYQGTDNTNAVIYDSVPLNGATAVPSNSTFRKLTEIYTGDVEGTRTETVTANGAWTLTAGSVLINASAGTVDLQIAGTTKARVSATGNLLLGGQTIDGTGVLQFLTGTTNAGGITLGNVNIFQTGSTTAQITATSLLMSGNTFTSGVSGGAGVAIGQSGGSGVLTVFDGSGNQMFAATGAAGKITRVANIVTTGYGVPAIYGLDNRTGLTTADGAATTLYTTVNGTSLFRITADIFATAAVTGTASFTITWTQNGGTRTMVVTATVVNTLGTATDLINPDTATAITSQLTGTFTGTFTVAGLVEQIK